MSHWRRSSVGELCDEGLIELQTGPFGSQLHAHDYVPHGVPVVPTEALRGRRINHSVLPHITTEKAETLERHRLKIGDILFARRGAQATGHIGFVRKQEEGFLCGTGAIRLRVIDAQCHKVLPEFLSHVFADTASVAWFKFHAIGATMPNLNEGIIRSFPLLIPPPNDQRAIADLLTALDDKIDLSRRMNGTLEAIARAIFKSWFVDFAPVYIGADGSKHPTAQFFPGNLVPSTVGDIPRGWHVRQLGAIADSEKGLSYKGQFLAASGMPMVNLGCFRGEGRFAPEGLKFYSGDYRERHIVRPGDLVIANTDITQKREVLGSPAIVPESAHDFCLFTHHVFAVRFKADRELWAPYVYYALLEPQFRDRARGFATGTTVLALPKDAVLDHLILDPGPTVLKAFAELLSPLRQLMNLNWDTSNTLLKIREVLLPKLLSGEIRVKQPEGIVEVPA